MSILIFSNVLQASISLELEKYTHLFVQPPPKVTFEAHSKIAKGDIITGVEKIDSQPTGWGVTIFPYPIDQVWRGLNHEENHVNLSPVSQTSIIKGESCGKIRHVFMQLPIPLLDDRWWVTEQSTNTDLEIKSLGKVRELVWSKIETNVSQEYIAQGIIQPFGIEVEETRGSWIVYEMNENETIGIYHSYVDPGGYIPAGPVNSFAAGSISDTIQAMHTYISQIPSESCHMNHKKK
jgi:hypothetical protein